MAKNTAEWPPLSTLIARWERAELDWNQTLALFRRLIVLDVAQHLGHRAETLAKAIEEADAFPTTPIDWDRRVPSMREVANHVGRILATTRPTILPLA